MRGYGESQKAYEKAKKEYKKKTGFSTVGEKMRAERSGSNKDNKKEQQQILKDIDKAQKQKDNKKTAGDKAQTKKDLQEGIDLRQEYITNTSEFLDDLKDAYKSGLFTGGTKTKALMEKYDLEPSDIVKLRVGIGQGLGTNIRTGTNVLQDVIKERGLNLDTSFVGGVEDKLLKARAESFFEPGMSKYDKLPLYENPEGIFQTAANMTYQYNPILRGFDFIAGGSPQGMRGLYFGREQLGLEGEELDQFAAAVANDPTLYEGIMNTPTMQRYQLDEFRAEANRNMMANRSDPDPISGTQPGAGGGDDSGGSDEGTTDPGSSYTPAPQNTYTFFDPNLGRYRSGTYDEYLQYVTAKDGGIIQLENGGETEEEKFVKENKKVNLRNILEFIRQNKEMPVTTEDQKKVQDETSKLLGDMLKERFTDQEGITELSIQSGDAVKMAEEDQPAGIFKNVMDRFGLPKTRPPEEEAPRMITVKITGTDRVIDVPMNQDTLQKLYDGTYQMTNKSALETGIFITPRADGGIIGLKDGGMDDMMQADSLMFRDPSDEGQWEYNV